MLERISVDSIKKSMLFSAAMFNAILDSKLCYSFMVVIPEELMFIPSQILSRKMR